MSRRHELQTPNQEEAEGQFRSEHQTLDMQNDHVKLEERDDEERDDEERDDEERDDEDRDDEERDDESSLQEPAPALTLHEQALDDLEWEGVRRSAHLEAEIEALEVASTLEAKCQRASKLGGHEKEVRELREKQRREMVLLEEGLRVSGVALGEKVKGMRRALEGEFKASFEALGREEAIGGMGDGGDAGKEPVDAEGSFEVGGEVLHYNASVELMPGLESASSTPEGHSRCGSDSSATIGPDIVDWIRKTAEQDDSAVRTTKKRTFAQISGGETFKMRGLMWPNAPNNKSRDQLETRHQALRKEEARVATTTQQILRNRTSLEDSVIAAQGKKGARRVIFSPRYRLPRTPTSTSSTAFRSGTSLLKTPQRALDVDLPLPKAPSPSSSPSARKRLCFGNARSHVLQPSLSAEGPRTPDTAPRSSVRARLAALVYSYGPGSAVKHAVGGVLDTENSGLLSSPGAELPPSPSPASRLGGLWRWGVGGPFERDG